VLIYLDLRVTLAQVVVKNPETGDEEACRIAFRNTNADGKTEVGLEFVQPSPISGACPSRLPIGPLAIPKSPAKLSSFLANPVTMVRQLSAPQITA
jgi:hypothetical protein